jgi:D-amino-acid dehydrogenase
MSSPRTGPQEMPEDEPDVLVVGGGVVGLFCAYHLRLRGHQVTVLERSVVGGPASCSSLNTGFVGTHGAAPLAEPGTLGRWWRLLDPGGPLYIRPRPDGDLLRWLWHFRQACNDRDAAAGFGVLLEMKQRSLAILREVCGTGELASSLVTGGMVLAYNTSRGFDHARRSLPGMVERGVPLRVLDTGQLRDLEPDVTLAIRGALYNEEGAGLRLPEFLLAFGRLLTRMGVRVHPGTGVVGFDVAGGRVTRVRTSRGDVRPAETVIAAGVWSTDCARLLGVGLTLQPVKGYTITVPAPDGAPTRPVALVEGRVAVMPSGDRLRLGGTLELSGRSTVIARRRVDALLDTVRRYLPRLRLPEADLRAWAGLRPCTPDSLPLLGRVESLDNVLVASGHGHIGMGLAPVGGRLIAQIIDGERPDLDIEPLRVGRFGGPR